MEWGYFLCISIIFAAAIIVPIVSIVFTNIMRRKNEGEAFEVKLNDVTRVPFGLHDTLSKKNKRQHLIDDCDIELVHCCKNDDIIARVDGASAKRVWKAGRELRMAGGFFPENVLCNENISQEPIPHNPKRTTEKGKCFFDSMRENEIVHGLNKRNAAIDKSMANRNRWIRNVQKAEDDKLVGDRGAVSESCKRLREKLLRDKQMMDSVVDVGGVPVPFSTIKTMKVENGEIVEVEIKCGNDYNYSNETIEPNRKKEK